MKTTAQQPSNHILPLGLYLKVGGILLALTVVTVWVAQFDLGAINLFVAMLIACVKATLVALFFMHLKYTNRLYAVILIIALLMVAIFIVFTMFDTMGRGRVYEIKSSPIDPRAVIYERAQPVDTVSDSSVVSDSVASGVDNNH